MKLIIESTTMQTTIDGVPARIWEGHTGTGIAVHCYITRVAVANGAPAETYTQFENELTECRPPSVEVSRLIPLRMIL